MSGKSDASSLNDEYETEELLVYVDLDTKLLDDQLSESNTKIKFLGIDTDRPIMQVNNKLFRGKYLLFNYIFLRNSIKRLYTYVNQDLFYNWLQVATNMRWERMYF